MSMSLKVTNYVDVLPQTTKKMSIFSLMRKIPFIKLIKFLKNIKWQKVIQKKKINFFYIIFL
jgi:hypothetical protein